jgi:hypothetical protein
VGALKARIAGVDAAKELAARQAEFEEAARAMPRSRPSAWKWARAWASCRS